MRTRTLIATHGALAVGLACCTISSVDDEGLSVEIEVAASPPPTTSLTSDLGYHIEIAEGAVALAGVALATCDGAASAARPPASVGGAVRQLFGEGVAWAHSTSSPTQLGVPAVLPLAPGDLVGASLGALHPPPGRYCTANVELGPADADAVLAPEDGSMVGLTLQVSGTYRGPDDEAPTPFSWASAARPSAAHEARFTLDAEGEHTARLVVAIDVATMFDGIDMATIDPALGADRVAARLADSLQIEVR